MKNYGPTFSVRRRLGLRWTDSKPPLAESIPYFILVGCWLIALLSLYAWLQNRDEADRAIAAKEAAEARADKAEKAFVRCLEGHAAFPIDGEFNAVWCDKRATVEAL